MKTSKRFETAIRKLYIAFHNNTLNPECCQQCAVGNILDNSDSWKYLSDDHGSLKLNYVGSINQAFGKTFNGYTPLELLHIEATFLKACGFELPLHHKHRKPVNPTDKDTLFKGLSAAIKFLCTLDNIPNIMDYQKMFEVETNRSKKKICLIN